MTRYMIATLILAAAMLTGCNRESSTPATAAQRSAAQAVDKAASDTEIAADRTVAADTKAATDAKIAADAKAVTDAKAAGDAKIAADTKAAADAKAAADTKAAADAALKATADEKTAKATSLITLLQQYIKDNKTDLAEATLSQLDALKIPLPAALQEQVEAARTALKAKKAVAELVK